MSLTNDEYNRNKDIILEKIPEEFRSHFSQLAYEYGHASGYSEILMLLEEMIYGLDQLFELYNKRIISEYNKVN